MDFRDRENDLTLSEIIKSGHKWYRRVEFCHHPSNTIVQGIVYNMIDPNFREDDIIGFKTPSPPTMSQSNEDWWYDFKESLIELHTTILNHTNVQGE
jgi:hypothetical protein